MSVNSEDDAKKALNISTWRELSKDKFMEFTSMLPDLSENVQKKIIEQIPHFRALATDSVQAIGESFGAALTSSDSSTDRVHAAHEEWRAALIGMLNEPELTFEQKMEIADRIGETVRGQSAQDTKHKSFIDTWYGKSLTAVGGALLVTVGVVVGRGRIGGGGST